MRKKTNGRILRSRGDWRMSQLCKRYLNYGFRFIGDTNLIRSFRLDDRVINAFPFLLKVI